MPLEEHQPPLEHRDGLLYRCICRPLAVCVVNDEL